MAQKTSISIIAGQRLQECFNDLGRITGAQDHEDIATQALALAANALEMRAKGYLVRAFHQTLQQDRFGPPISPAYIRLEMKQPSSPPLAQVQTLLFSLSAEALAHAGTIGECLHTTSTEDAVHFSLLFAQAVAAELQTVQGVSRLAFVDGGGRRPVILTRTPYDRPLHNPLSRIIHQICEHFRRTPPPPGC